MNSLSLAYAAARSRSLQSGLSIVAIAAGVALLCGAFLLSGAINTAFSKNAKGVDMVVGAKGSPLQLVLSTIYHTDIPTGNIDEHDAERIERNQQVAKVIPLAIGDNYKGWRVVGTTPEYLGIYNAAVKEGALFEKPFEVVAGANTGLAIGAEFSASHGLVDDGDVHEEKYTVTGVLEPTGTALDRLLVTPIRSVQEAHEHHHDEGHKEDEHEEHDITALLIKVRSPTALMNLPREINRSGNFQAAVPSYEMARLSKSLGMGHDVITLFGLGLVVLSILMLLSTLASSLAARRYDIAVLRVLGASPLRLIRIVVAEAMMIGGAGIILGLICGHLLAFTAVSSVSTLGDLIAASTMLLPQSMDIMIIIGGITVSVIAGLFPALSAARTDIAGLLAKA